jgi:hypothetical protein
MFTHNISPEVLVRLPVLCNSVSNICSIRRRNKIQAIRSVNFPETLKYTQSGVNFLLYDNANLSNHILIYSTNANLIHLANSKVWVCDGTFRSAPYKYNQIYTLQGLIKTNLSLWFFV